MRSAIIASEVEAKLLARRPSDLDAIAKVTRVGPYRILPRDKVHLHSVYLDTNDFALTRHGIAVRLRRNGKEWEATAKWAGTVKGDVHERPELNVSLSQRPSLPFQLPEGRLRAQLLAFTSGRPLEAILRSSIMRRRFDVVAIDAGRRATVLAELALDRVQLRSPKGSASASYCEVEIECIKGDRRDVRSLARLLERAFSLDPSPDTKFSLGMKRVYGGEILDPVVTNIADADSLAAAVRKVVWRHLVQLRLNDPGTRLGRDPEALHDMRVAVRRLRAVLRAFPEGFQNRQRERFRAELRWLGGVLGTVRDVDVQLERLAMARTTAPPRHRAAVAGLQEFLRLDRRRRRKTMIESLESSRYLNLLLRIDQFSRSRPPSRRDLPAAQPAAAIGRRAVKGAFQHLVKGGSRAQSTLTPEDLHAVRIRAKRLRYILEFLADLTGKPGSRLVRHLVALQDLLGRYHDSVVAADSIQHYVDAQGVQGKPGHLLALGALVGSHLRDAEIWRNRFDRTWKRFCRKRTQRELQAVLERLETLSQQSTAETKRQRPPGHRARNVSRAA
ncbi:MAG: CHAD domain-containing protein [Deltaproteobacteria bacterium]|nr:CHAD domain-containing protein [Deltaproteobacteria bacterium]